MASSPKASDKDKGPEFTITVPAAGKRYFNIGRNASYQAARAGELPTIKIGGRLRVPVAIVERKLRQD